MHPNILKSSCTKTADTKKNDAEIAHTKTNDINTKIAHTTKTNDTKTN
jgi:hypothetical protein